MPEPDVFHPASLEFYRQETLMPKFYRKQPMPPGSPPARDTAEALLRAANKAHTNVRLLVEVNDRLRHDQLQLIETLKTERAWRKWMVGTLFPVLAGIIVELLRLLLRIG